MREHLLAQDVVYVGGGSMRNMLAIWREHGLDEILRECWERGIVLAGLSAGAMCWFEGGVTTSTGRPEPVAGLGLLPGSLSVHLDGEPERRPVYLARGRARRRCRRAMAPTTASACCSRSGARPRPSRRARTPARVPRRSAPRATPPLEVPLRLGARQLADVAATRRRCEVRECATCATGRSCR